MMLPSDPTIIAATAAVTVAVVGWFAHTILGMRDTLQDLHRAVFDHNGRDGVLTVTDRHEARLKRHSDALRVHGLLGDE